MRSQFFVAACALMLVAALPVAKSEPRVGINLAGPCDWNTELPFVDVFHFSRAWISQKQGAAWGKGPELALDEHGWVKQLDEGCFAETPLCTIEGGHYPAGVYTVLYEGEGKLTFQNATIKSESPGRILIEPNVQAGGFFLQIKATNPQKYIRNIRVIMPGYVDSYQTDPWNPTFLKRWQGMAVLRFMDFMQTNDSALSKWDDRPKVEDANYTSKGLPVELLIDLANRLKADPWFCMPHRADDDFVRNFARVTKERLDPSRKVWIEYSNEVWNGQFQQAKYASEQGLALKFGSSAWEAGWHYTAYRSSQIFALWQEAFGGHERLVRVLAAQAVNPYVANQILSFQTAYKNADVLAIAPYVGLCVSPKKVEQAGALEIETVRTWSVDRALDYLEFTAIPEVTQWIEGNKKVADQYGLKLVAYEAGQHMVGIQGGESDEGMTRLFAACNANPRMGVIYEKYLNAWAAGGGDMVCMFSSVSQWGKWGNWGAMQYVDDNPAQSPKYQAILKWGRQHGQDFASQ